MALDINSLLNPDAAPIQQDIARQYKLADLLRQQSLESSQGQMVSGHYVAPSITQHLSNLLKGYTAGQKEQQANQETKDLAQKTMESYANLLRDDDPKPTQPMQYTPIDDSAPSGASPMSTSSQDQSSG